MFKLTTLFIFLLLNNTMAFAELNGKALYFKNCNSCHQSEGKGGLGVPFTKENFKYLSDDYLAKTIRYGRPGRVMPAFEMLSDMQVKVLVAYLRKRSETTSPPEPDVTVTGDVKNGHAIFLKNCQQCHGKEGKGIGRGTGKSYSRKREFDVIPPAIGNEGFLKSSSDAMLRRFIAYGRKDSIMPNFVEMGFKQQDIDDVIVYLRSLVPAENTVNGGEKILPNPTMIIDSPNDFETTVTALKEALHGQNYRVFPDRYIEQGLLPEWEVNKKQIALRYCNFNRLYEMLKTDPRIGVSMPCRITVVQTDDGKVKIIAMNMALIARLFNNKQLQSYAAQMHEIQLEIIDEVTF